MNIAKNTAYFTFALVLQKILSFSYFIFLARFLGPENLGKYYFAVSFASIFAILMDLGVSNVQIRDTARLADDAQKTTNLILNTKFILAFFVLGITVLAINLSGADDLAVHLVYIAALCVILDSFALTFFSYIRGFHNMVFESIASVVFQAIVIGIGVYFAYAGFDLRYIMSALLFASFIFCAYAAYLAFTKFALKFELGIDWQRLKKLSLSTLPFAVYAVFQKAYTFLDTVLLAFLADDKAVGIYQAAFKIVNALQFLPMAFIASLYPAFSRYWAQKDTRSLALTFENSLKYLMLVAVPVSFGVIAIADKLVLIFKEDFIPSIEPLRLSMIALLFLFLTYPFGAFLNACDKQKINAWIMGAVLVLNAGLNILLIPRFSAVGSAVSAAISAFVLLILSIFAVRGLISINKKEVGVYFLKVLLSGIAMALIAFWVADYSLLVAIILSAVVYVFLTVASGAIQKELITKFFVK